MFLPNDAALGAALRDWLTVTLAGDGAFVCLAVGASTLPLYHALPTGARAWEGKRIMPLDEVIGAPAGESFSDRLNAALPDALRARSSPLAPAIDPDALEEALVSEKICGAVLGLGPDGHIAFNQPGSEVTSTTRVVDLTAENRARIGNVAARAVTLGVATLLCAQRIALVVSGEGKRAALARVLEGPAASDVPASFLRTHEDLTVLIEEEACE